MKTLYKKLHRCGCMLLMLFVCFSFFSCGDEALDYNHPDVDLFVKQLKAGKYSVQSPEGLNNVPKFTKDDIEGLLKYAEDLTVIPSFRWHRYLIQPEASCVWVNVSYGR